MIKKLVKENSRSPKLQNAAPSSGILQNAAGSNSNHTGSKHGGRAMYAQIECELGKEMHFRTLQNQEMQLPWLSIKLGT